jgi:hypothetical protein
MAAESEDEENDGSLFHEALIVPLKPCNYRAGIKVLM